MTKYASVVFMSGDDAIEPLEILEEQGEGAAIEYLAQWDYGEYSDVRDHTSAGNSDYVMESAPYRLNYNLRMGYIGLERLVED